MNSFTRTAHVWTTVPRPSGVPRWIEQKWSHEIARGSYEAMRAVAGLYGYAGPKWSPRDDEKTDRYESGGMWYDIEEVPRDFGIVLCPECRIVKHRGEDCWACNPPHVSFPTQYQCRFCGGGHKDQECHDTTDRRLS